MPISGPRNRRACSSACSSPGRAASGRPRSWPRRRQAHLVTHHPIALSKRLHRKALSRRPSRACLLPSPQLPLPYSKRIITRSGILFKRSRTVAARASSPRRPSTPPPASQPLSELVAPPLAQGMNTKNGIVSLTSFVVSPAAATPAAIPATTSVASSVLKPLSISPLATGCVYRTPAKLACGHFCDDQVAVLDRPPEPCPRMPLRRQRPSRGGRTASAR